MRLRWVGDRAQADRAMLAELYEVSERTIRRRCTPIGYDQRGGHHHGGTAWYDVVDSAKPLTDIAPRPARVAATYAYRFPRHQESA